jgi:hypothetical protein
VALVRRAAAALWCRLHSCWLSAAADGRRGGVAKRMGDVPADARLTVLRSRMMQPLLTECRRSSSMGTKVQAVAHLAQLRVSELQARAL